MIIGIKNIQVIYHIVKHALKEIPFKAVVLIVCFLSFCIIVKAGNDGGIEETQHAKPLTSNAASVNSFALVPNQSSELDYNLFGVQSTQQSKKIKNIITFSINEANPTNKLISQDFTATVTVIIDYGHSATSLNTPITKTFTVTYSKAEGAKYNARQYFSFDNAEYVKITLQSITAPTIGSLDTKDILVLKNDMVITRYFELPAVVPAPTTFFPTAPVDLVPDHLTVNFSWPAFTGGGVSTGNNGTQLEWAWIENETANNYMVNGVPDNNLIFKNATRVDLALDKVNYEIPLLYDAGLAGGKLYYRIRAVNIKKSGGRSDGPWNVATPFDFAGHNNNLNWQATTTFAEEGKRKTVVQYFDGSLRGRQTVTKDNSTNTVVTAESFYDAQGRPAIQILPTPGITNIIQYQANLNLFNGQIQEQDPSEIFDMQAIDLPNSLTPGLQTISGTSNYYSPINADPLAPASIPDAEQYPYTVTRYTPDATGRVMAQSGVGAAHKMGSGHETKYYYGTPSQEELDGLFGTEVGDYSHYAKNMVKDANGQMSVSYVDMHGRTIATALAGVPPPNVLALDNNNPLHYLNQGGTPISRNLLDNSSNIVKGNGIESVNSLLVPSPTLYQFTYALNPQVLEMAACNGANPATLCYDCLYDLEIAITDESGDNPPIIKTFSNVSLNPDDDCTTATPSFKDLTSNAISNVITFPITLGPGSYSIRKTLSISESSFQKYKDLYMSKSVCKTQQELTDSIYNVLLSTSSCENKPPVTCQTCLTDLGSENDYKINYRTSLGLPNPTVPASDQIENEISVAYNTALQNCNKMCNTVSQALPTLREMMLRDMVPYSGQYAVQPNADNPGGTAHTMYDKYNIFSTKIPGSQPFYKYPMAGDLSLSYYLDNTNNVDKTIQPVTGDYTFLNNTSPDDFEHLFNDSWAASLLPHHPEYQRLLFAEANLTPSYNWINTFTQTASFTTAQSNGYLNPTTNDPFFVQAPTYVNSLTDQLANYQYMNTTGDPAQNVGMWQLAYGDVRYKNIGDADLRKYSYQHAPNTPPPYAGFSAAENDQAWQMFRSLYAAVRNNYVNDYVATQRPLTVPTDEADLIFQQYRLWFPRDDKQTAAQNGWTWWPTATGQPPLNEGANGGAAAAATTYSDQCNSYIDRWKAQLLQCDALANSPDKDAILNEITTRMHAVCVNGSNQANPNGASDVAPGTPASFTDRSFEDVIKNVFIAHSIIGSDGKYTDNFCNPFVIEWPKPYGKGPKIIDGEQTNQVDSCNCSQFSIIKAQAVANNVDINNLAAFNQYLLTNYSDTLSQAMFTALQLHCSSNLSPACVAKDLEATIDLYNAQYPNGGLGNCGTANPADLQISSRSANLPAQYVASNTISFLPGFESGVNDDFIAYIGPGCDTVSACHDLFVNFFNSHYNNNPALTWSQVNDLYNLKTGHSPYICGYANYSCNELLNVECHFSNLSISAARSSNPLLTCQQNFTTYFNSYYHTIVPLSWADILNLYATCDTSLSDHICGGVPMNFCGPPLAAEDCSNTLPYILLQPVPLPAFLKCGYTQNPPCITCAGLSALTAEYKTVFTADVNTAPIFTGSNLTPAQVQYNISYARFINYRTGFQYNWLDYSKAAATAAPACDLANYTANTTALQDVICADKHPLAEAVTVVTETPCAKVYTMAITLAQQIYQTRQQYLLDQFDAAYKAKCLAAKDIEQFSVNYTTSEYHYTLYYYDMAGGLVKTVPPKGVHPDFSATFTNSVKAYRDAGDYTLPAITPAHSFVTDYRYNSLSQVVSQHTPDAATSQFWYDALGRLVVSQNAKQLADNKYSYTLYDALGRITEVGQKPQAAGSMTQTVSQDAVALDTWINTTGDTKEQITNTVYDLPYPPFIGDPTYIVQQNLRNRVSYTTTKNLATDLTPAAATFYTYDIHGNVDKLLQDYHEVTQNMASTDSRYKVMTYDYDLISGKVNQVNYQPDQTDAFYHKYNYDAENRLTEVQTSRDNIYWERDAVYNYYKHGPLARTELGLLQVQGIDYAYTLQGWLKGINQTSLDPAKDIGLDGSASSTVAKDALSFALHYYDENVGGTDYLDYKPIDPTKAFFARPGNATGLTSLYNGNIASMTVNNAGLLKATAGTNNNMALLYNYRYDQLNRLVSMQAYKGLDAAANSWNNASTIQDYKEAISYDPNGNIETYSRNGNADRLAMDNMYYTYKPTTNQLDNVNDLAPDAADVDYNKYNDIKQGQASGNYQYDAIGNLTADLTTDAAQHINGIDWSVYGKILSIHKPTGDISYNYDASGNRIGKTAAGVTTIYVRDASGNVMSVYESAANGIPVQKETHLYGSSRLGLQTELTAAPETIIIPSEFGKGILSTFTRGEKIFELSNHLGNVLVTISDKKIGHTTDGTTIDYYNADVITANDYFPGGMQMPGRKYQAGAASYQYGFSGKRKDNEMYGEGNAYDFGDRILDPRLGGRWFSVDPLQVRHPGESPYLFVGGNPIVFADPDGRDRVITTTTIYELGNGKFYSLTNTQTLKGDYIKLRVTDQQGKVHYQYYNTFVNKTNYVNAKTGESTGGSTSTPASTLAFTSDYDIGTASGKLGRLWEKFSSGITNGVAFTSESGGGNESREGIYEVSTNIDGLRAMISALAGGGPGKLEVPNVEMIPEITHTITELAEQIIEDKEKAGEKTEKLSPTSSSDNTKQGTMNTVKATVQSGTPAKPIDKTNVPLTKHGYSIQTGVFKDTVITKVNKPGDTTRTYKTVTVPIKPKKVKF